MALDEHLFRREAGRLVAALTRVFGVHNLALAEDVVQDALCRALEVWKFRGVPDNPSAWLMTAAKNRALDVLRRERTARTFAPEVGQLLESEWTLRPTLDSLFEPEAIRDDELRMMFSCCDPRLAEEAQIVLILHVLCGFRTREIAEAFLSTPAAIEKRIARGKRSLASSKTLFDLQSGEAFQTRLLAVQRALYLLFNEGYHGASEAAVRSELCDEAIRLVSLLLEHPPAAVPGTYALGALMCFHAARLPARLDGEGALIPLPQQDRRLWDQSLLAHGKHLIELSARGTEVTDYHVEAAIASVHAMAGTFEETRWDRIVALYDTLLRLRSSPVVELQRALAVAEVDGPGRALAAIRAIGATDRLRNYPFYFAALGELELRSGNPKPARRHFQAALGVARNRVERAHFESRIRACEVGNQSRPA